MTSESMNDVMYIVVVYNQYVSVYYYHSGRVETINGVYHYWDKPSSCAAALL